MVVGRSIEGPEVVLVVEEGREEAGHLGTRGLVARERQSVSLEAMTKQSSTQVRRAAEADEGWQCASSASPAVPGKETHWPDGPRGDELCT